MWATRATCLGWDCQSVLLAIYVIRLMLMVGLATSALVIAEKMAIWAFQYLGMVVWYWVLCRTHVFLHTIHSPTSTTAALRSRLLMEALPALSVAPFAWHDSALRYRLLISMTLLFWVKEEWWQFLCVDIDILLLVLRCASSLSGIHGLLLGRVLSCESWWARFVWARVHNSNLTLILLALTQYLNTELVFGGWRKFPMIHG